MGILDRFRKPAGNPLLEELIRLYALVRKTPHEPGIMNDWWEGRADGETIAIQDRGDGIIVYAGDIVEVTGIYLVRIAPGSSGPAGNSPHRLDRIVGAQGAALASRFVLGAHPPGDFDHPQLRLPALRDGIPRLSPSVREISIYENDRGLSLQLDHTATRETAVADLDLALTMVRGLKASAA
jgi:hypothetical protein